MIELKSGKYSNTLGNGGVIKLKNYKRINKTNI